FKLLFCSAVLEPFVKVLQGSDFASNKSRISLSEIREGSMQLTLEFGGGLELLCDSVKIHNVNVNPQDGEDKLTMKYLLSWVRSNLIKERPEMFMKGDSVRPGVLVLVNDCDWELSGQLDTTLEEKDMIVFISTLHGGYTVLEMGKSKHPFILIYMKPQSSSNVGRRILVIKSESSKIERSMSSSSSSTASQLLPTLLVLESPEDGCSLVTPDWPSLRLGV
ncbi:Ubiquitin-related modifier 1, partial [Dillenia turbinata]